MTQARLHKLLTVVIAGTLAGLVLAGAALPLALVLTLGFSTLTAPYTELPKNLVTPPTAQRSTLYAADGTTMITSFYEEDRSDVPLDRVAPVMRQALLAAEDARFYEHNGVDLRGIVRAFTANRSGGARQGASTLTMQYVRNVLGTDPTLTERERAAATEISTARKIQEIRYALALERELSKDEILGRYLNIVYFGSGAYGIAAASRRYFSKSPADLTLPEAALLAGLVQAPHTDDPIHGDADAALRRQAYVLDRMVDEGMIQRAEAERARAGGLALRPSVTPDNCASVPEGRTDWAFFCDYFVTWWKAQPAFGASPDERLRTLRRGGFRIVSSLDPDVQQEAQDRVLMVYGPDSRHVMPTAVVQPGTGRVLALAVNRSYGLGPNPPGQPNRPYTVNPLVTGGADIVGYQAGSTFKIFTVLAALEAGLPLDTRFDAPTRIVTPWPIDGPASCGGYWCPANSDPASMDGEHTMWTAFGRSVNTYFAWLAEQVGVDRVVEMAERLGIELRADADARRARYGAREWGPFILGVAATTPLDLAIAYATVAAEGVGCKPLPVNTIVDRSGRPLDVARPNCRQVVDRDVARAAADAARCPLGDQSAFGRCDGGTATGLRDRLGRPVIGKTGSSEGFGTETVVVATPQLAVAAMAANPEDPQDPAGKAVQAEMLDAVADLMAAVLRGQPVRDFAPPSEAIAYWGTDRSGD